MKMKKTLALILVIGILLPVIVFEGVFSVSAAETHNYISDGLVSFYNSKKNTSAGYREGITVWEDLISDNDITVKNDASNYFRYGIYHLNSAKNYFPTNIVNLVNGAEFTMEISMRNLVTLGADYATIVNSDNDYFALFRRVSTDYLEFKFAANASSGRPWVPSCDALLKDALITITYKVGGNCNIYIDGVLKSTKPSPNYMGADTLFFGHDAANKIFKAQFFKMRFYNRELSADEVSHNAFIDCEVPNSYVQNGLVSYYNGAQSTRKGHDNSSNVWEDLVGNNDISVLQNSTNYFTDYAYRLNSHANYFPQGIVNLVNSNEFTVEIAFKGLTSYGTEFNTFLNSSNDNIALFRRNNTDVLEFKYTGSGWDYRHVYQNANSTLQDAVVTITYKVGVGTTMYINGEKVSSHGSAPQAMNITDLYIGHADATRNFEGYYRSMRFYNRALSSGDVKRNALVDGYVSGLESDYVSEGLVSFYSGISNTRNGYNASSPAWEDLVGNNDITLVSGNVHFNKAGLYVHDEQQFLPNGLLDIVNSDTFTVELQLGSFNKLDSWYNVLLASTDYKFALYRNNADDTLVWRYGGLSAEQAMKTRGAAAVLPGATISMSYDKNGKSRLYINGVLLSEMTTEREINIDDLFLGNLLEVENARTVYMSMRFYDKALSEEEIISNAKADGCYINPGLHNPGYVKVAQVPTNVSGGISAVREISSFDELRLMMNNSKLPASAIFNIDKDLNIVDENGVAFTTIGKLLEILDYKIIPTFRISDSETIVPLKNFLFGIAFCDVNFISDNTEIMKTARDTFTRARGIIDLRKAYTSDLTEDDIAAIRRAVRGSYAAGAILPASICKNDAIQRLYDLKVYVWADAGDNPTDTECYNAILSGALGVVTDDTDSVLNKAAALPQNTMTRSTQNLGHRSIPSRAPENTIEGAQLAYSLGANAIEIDIHLTSDKKIVVMHDTTTDRTCNGSMTVANATLAQLQTLYVNKGYESHATYKYCRIPTLKQYLDFIKDKDCHLVIEIKCADTAIVPLMKQEVEAAGVYTKCSVITFNYDQMVAMKNQYPEMSVGNLGMSGTANESNADYAANNNTVYLGTNNTTLNPSYSGFGKNMAIASHMRFTGSYPWTFGGDVATLFNYNVWGYSAITTNNVDALQPFVKNVRANNVKNAQLLKLNESLAPSLNVAKFGGTSGDSPAEIVILSGKDCVEVSGVSMKGVKNGMVSFILKYTYSINGVSATHYTQPITINVGSNCDVNADGLMDSIDLNTLRKHLLEKLTAINPDVNGDGVSNVLDLVRLKRILSGIVI